MVLPAYAVCGTEKAYGAMRCAVLRYRMVLPGGEAGEGLGELSGRYQPTLYTAVPDAMRRYCASVWLRHVQY
eukprot:2328055-Rhodomonas_salina.1